MFRVNLLHENYYLDHLLDSEFSVAEYKLSVVLFFCIIQSPVIVTSNVFVLASYLMFKDLKVLCKYYFKLKSSFLSSSSDGTVYLYTYKILCKADRIKTPHPKGKQRGQALGESQTRSGSTQPLCVPFIGRCSRISAVPHCTDHLFPRTGEVQVVHKASLNFFELAKEQLQILSINSLCKCLDMDCTCGF